MSKPNQTELDQSKQCELNSSETLQDRYNLYLQFTDEKEPKSFDEWLET